MCRTAVSKHIKILYNAGFISIIGIGRERYCILKQDGFNELQDFINYFDKFWTKKLQKLQDVLNNKAKTNEQQQLKIKNKSLTATIEVAKLPQEVFNCITDIPKQWSKGFEGNSEHLQQIDKKIC